MEGEYFDHNFNVDLILLSALLWCTLVGSQSSLLTPYQAAECRVETLTLAQCRLTLSPESIIPLYPYSVIALSLASDESSQIASRVRHMVLCSVLWRLGRWSPRDRECRGYKRDTNPSPSLKVLPLTQGSRPVTNGLHGYYSNVTAECQAAPLKAIGWQKVVTSCIFFRCPPLTLRGGQLCIYSCSLDFSYILFFQFRLFQMGLYVHRLGVLGL